MGNLLKLISFVLFMQVSAVIKGQGFRYEVSFPILSIQRTNIPVFKKLINDNYLNNYKIPNARLGIKYNKLMIALETYSFSDQTTAGWLDKEGQILDMNLNSYSVLLGYELYNMQGLSIDIGSGITYTRPDLIHYFDYYIQVWELAICNEDNKVGPVFWGAIKKKVYKDWFIGLNIRFNPMFNEFSDDAYNYCVTPHEQDRLHYFVGQIAVGYEF